MSGIREPNAAAGIPSNGITVVDPPMEGTVIPSLCNTAITVYAVTVQIKCVFPVTLTYPPCLILSINDFEFIDVFTLL